MRKILCTSLFLLSVSLFLYGQNNLEEVKKILAKTEKLDENHIWQLSSKLEYYEDKLSVYLEKNYFSLSPKARLLCIYVLAKQGRLPRALPWLKKFIHYSKHPVKLRKQALYILEREAKQKKDVEWLAKWLEQPGLEVELRIEAAKILRKIGKNPKGSRILKRYLRSREEAIQILAALALAEVGNPSFRVRKILERAAQYPTPTGEKARLLLKQLKLLDTLSETQGLTPEKRLKALEAKVEELKRKNKELERRLLSGVNTGKALLDEILDKISRYYDYRDPKEVDKMRLIESAAKGILDSLDPHSVYFTVEETRRFKESISSKYPGIGAYVQKDKNGFVVITRPIYSGPAYKAGLRSGDVIYEIYLEGQWRKTTEFKLTELVQKLRGPAGSSVRLRIWRKGWKNPREFTIIRQFVRVPMVYYSLLPGKVGYLQLTSFGSNCSKEFESALTELEKKGMEGLILDLRNNPGGLLVEAVKIADFFLPKGKLIVYSKGRNPLKAPKKEYWSTDEGTHPDYPMVILVNGGTASAAEILSGCLKIHGRATLLGTKTYGKGSVQELIPLRATRGRSMIKLTIARYYLPDGTNIDHKGLQPDLRVLPKEISFSADLYFQLLERKEFDSYLEKYYSKYKSLFQKLAIFDGRDPSRYPHFEELYQKLKDTKASRDLVRRVLRSKIRQRLADERGRLLVGDIEEDYQLRKAVILLLKKLGKNPREFPEYRGEQ